MDYAKCAKEIYEAVGGRDNLIRVAHCATRLRLVTVDNSGIDRNVLENIEGVKGVFESNGLLQLIIGTGSVNKVYDEFLVISGMEASTKEEAKAAAAARQPLPVRMVKALGDVFVPILPAIVAAGLMMGLVEALGNFYPSFKGTDMYAWMDLVANTAIVYLPVLVAISSAKVFGGNIYLGGTIGMLLMHMNLISSWSAAGMAAEEIPTWHILGLSIRQVNYQGHVIPIIISIWIMCQIEKFLHRHVPEMLDLILVPLITVFVTAFITMTLVGPAFIVVENNILTVVEALLELPLGIGSFICGAVYPLTVICGIHHMFNVLEAGMIAENGRNIWLPVSCSANFAMCMSCVAVFVKTRNVKTRSLALPAGLSAALGITEPAIFGINLRYFSPLVCGMVGAAFGAAAGSLMGVYGSSYGVTGIPGFLITTHCTLQYSLMLAIAGGIAFVLTLIVWKGEAETAGNHLTQRRRNPAKEAATDKATADDENSDTENTAGVRTEAGAEKTVAAEKAAGVRTEAIAEKTAAVGKAYKATDGEKASVGDGAAGNVAAEKNASAAEEMNGNSSASRQKQVLACAPMSGNVIPRSQIPDPAFAEGILGDGFGIEPAEGVVYAPCDGVIAVAADTGHLVGMRSSAGADLLIHVGIDTVNLDGAGFDLLVKQGDSVGKGQKLLTFDMDRIKAAGYSTVTAVLVSNAAEFEGFALTKTGLVTQGEQLLLGQKN